MEWGFGNTDGTQKAENASLNALRGQAMHRLGGLQQSLEGKGVATAFTRASSKRDPIGDTGFLGSLIFDMFVGGAFTAFLGAHFHLGDVFNHAAVAATAEGVALVRDQEANNYRSRKLSGYPEGRRRCALEEAKRSRKFNLVSGSQRQQFSFDVLAELACMFEILDMIDALEGEGAKTMRIDVTQPAYKALKQATGKMRRQDTVRSFSAPMQMAV